MSTFKLRIVTTDESFYRGDCVNLVFNTTDGKYGIKANHRNMLGTIKAGELTFRGEDGIEIKTIVSDGIIKVKNNRVAIMVETIKSEHA